MGGPAVTLPERVMSQLARTGARAGLAFRSAAPRHQGVNHCCLQQLLAAPFARAHESPILEPTWAMEYEVLHLH